MKCFHRTFFLLVALPTLILVANAAHATDYYVDQSAANASDDGSGSADSPWRSIGHAMAYPLQPGDTVHVKPGTYHVTGGGSWDRPVFNPSASGTPENPVTIVADPIHSVTLDNGGQYDQPLIGTHGHSYIVWDGFVIDHPGDKAVAVFGDDGAPVYGITIQNLEIRGVWKDIADNADGIRLEHVRDSVVRNNRIHDVHNGPNTGNAAGIKEYDTANVVVEHNEIFDAVTGIYDKIQNLNNTYRYNLIHDVAESGIYFRSPTDAGSPSQDSRGSQVYGNVIARCAKAVEVAPSQDRGVYDTSIFNNTFVDYTDAGVAPSKYNGTITLYNNIFSRAQSPARGDVFTFDEPVHSIAMSDYNVFAAAQFEIGAYVTNHRLNSLAEWQGTTAFDAHSLGAEPTFAQPAHLDFRLAANSPGRRAGHVGGTAGGDLVDAGAYADDGVVVGILPGSP